MQIVPLTPVANQQVSFTVGGNYWQVAIYQAVISMAVTISRDGVLLVSGLRVVAGTLALPYDYLWKGKSGNLLFTVEPDWTKFGGDCLLYYLTEEEAVAWQSQP